MVADRRFVAIPQQKLAFAGAALHKLSDALGERCSSGGTTC